MVSNVVIRPAELADADGIAAVHVLSWRAAYRSLLPQHVLEGLSVERRAVNWREILRSPDGSTLVGVDAASGRVIGFVNVGPTRDADAAKDVGELRAIYVLEDWWGTGTGTGRRLHDAALHVFSAEFTQATVWVLDANERARRFYTRRGWTPDGATKTEDRGQMVLDEVRYRRSLPADAD